MTNPEPVYDKKGQLEQIQEVLLDGEQLIAVYDAIGVGTGFIGLTDKRVVFMDKSFVGKEEALTSVPYGKISAVSLVSNRSIAGQFFSSGKIAVHIGTHIQEIEFRGDKKTKHVHDVIMHYTMR